MDGQVDTPAPAGRPPFLPAPTLPKGGGAIRGISEKLTVNAARGTCSQRMPLFTSPGRAGAEVALSLVYDSGNPNSPFGMGWGLDVPTISRKTSRGLPTYTDDDTFVLAGSEDLVPDLATPSYPDTVDGVACTVTRFRPRVETVFTRVEKCTPVDGSPARWRTVSRDNVTSHFRTAIADPATPGHLFEWLLDETRDDRGNVTMYEYQAETLSGVDTAAAWERHRLGTVAPQRYLRTIRYANATPGQPDGKLIVEFEYDDQPRPDPFSVYRAGFEVRTWRLCRRVLMYHAFDAEDLGPGPIPRLVRSTDLFYDTDPAGVHLIAATQTGYLWENGAYASESLPKVEFEYTTSAPEAVVRVANAEHLPSGVDGSGYQWADLDGEGLPGVLTQHGGSWFYYRNQGGGWLGPPQDVTARPAIGQDGAALALADVAADGSRALVRHGPTLHGYQERDGDSWGPFTAFASTVVVDWSDESLRHIDLDGDGLTDLLFTDGGEFRWHRSLGRDGFGPQLRAAQAWEEQKGPVLLSRGQTEAVLLADMSGDGLTDLVRVRDGEVCYWPNLGYGRFGAKVTMGGAPLFEPTGLFDPARLRLADIDGNGVADILYIGRSRVTYWVNHSGNGFGPPRHLAAVPDTDRLETIETVDFLGTGTTCLVWSSPKPSDAGSPLRYIDLNRAVSTWLPDGDAGWAGHKPGLLCQVRNNLGAATRVVYAPSTRFFCADRAAGRPWLTRLPFPVHVVQRVEAYDEVAQTRLVSGYHYRHGYFDGPEREFRGFGMVEQLDAESFRGERGVGLFTDPVSTELHRPPGRLRSWFHLGTPVDMRGEWYAGDAKALRLKECELPEGITAVEWREALRALAGQPLRTETYADDGAAGEDHAFETVEHRYRVVRVQPAVGGRHAVFRTHPLEAVHHHYERNPADPRVTHELTLEVDAYNFVRRSASLAYPRRVPAIPEQAKPLATWTLQDAVHTDTATVLRLASPVQTRVYEVTTLSGVDDLLQPGLEGKSQLVSRSRVAYWDDTLSGPLPEGQVGARALVHQTSRAVFAPALLTQAFGNRVTPAMLTGEGRYVFDDGLWWSPSGVQHYDPAAFYLPARVMTPFGNESSAEYDKYRLLPAKTRASQIVPYTALVTLFRNDYRVLAPNATTDANGNRTRATFDALSRVTATWAQGREGTTDGDPDGMPGAVFEYHLTTLPVSSLGSTREAHGDANARWQRARVYSDGSGRAVLTKVLAEPSDDSPDPRWIGTGRTVLDNKGQPVKQYEPYYSTSDAYENEPALVAQGVTPIWHYDALNRVVRTDHPDGTHSRVVFGPWHTENWDPIDTVLDSRWYADRGSPSPGGSEPSDPEQRAAWLAAAHASTPSVSHVDTLGRGVLGIADGGTLGLLQTRTELDIQGNTRSVTDPRDIVVSQQIHDMAGRILYSSSPDAGERWTLPDAGGAVIRAWDSRQHEFTYTYDPLRRPIARINGTAVTDLHVYGETHPDAVNRNLIGRPYLVFDGAGVAKSLRYDFKGNPLIGRRQLATGFLTTPDWSSLSGLPLSTVETQAAAMLEAEVYQSATTYDALNRPVMQVLPDGTVITPARHVSGRLDTMAVRLPGEVGDTLYVKSLRYNAKGQRLSIRYGNDVVTDYTYNPLDWRLRALVTTRSGQRLQDLAYTRDPSGNVVEVRDTAAQTVFFAGQVVAPATRYRYDALNRLTQANGREHASLGADPGHHEPDFAPLPHPNDANALRNYLQTYTYDVSGNIATMAHQAGAGSWTRTYDNATDSNRLKGHSTSGPNVVFQYDEHGNMTAMPHLSGALSWDDADRLARVDLGGGGRAYYAYDSSGQRVRKVLVRDGGLVEERIYLGGYEEHRRRLNGTLTFQRNTVHVLDDSRRIAMVETLVTPQTETRVRYQIGNHLGSSVLELSAGAQVISYEEYHPFGTTSLWLGSGSLETSERRYRYTGKEKDEETSLYYHGARYYACWLGRWTAADSSGFVDGTNVYAYVRNNPIVLMDPNGNESALEREAARRNANRLEGSLTPDEIADVYKRPPENLIAPDTPEFHQKVRDAMDKGRAKRKEAKKEAKAHPPATKEEEWKVAKDSARNWVIDKVSVSPTTAALIPALIPNALLTHYVLKPLKVAEPPEFPRNLHDYQLRQSYDFMQGTLTTTELGVTFAIGPILETVSVLRAPAALAPTLETTGSVGAALRNDPTIFTPPGEFVPVLRGGRYMNALEAQNAWSGQAPVYVGDKIMLWEYRAQGTYFDSARVSGWGDLEALQEFKWDYTGSIRGANPWVIRNLRLQARTQWAIADELGVPLEWHVPQSQLTEFQNVVGPRLARNITWVPYDLQTARAALGF